MGQGRPITTGAQGRITIDTSDLQNVSAISQKVGQEAEKNLSRIGVGAAQAQSTIASLSGTVVQAQGPVAAFLASSAKGSAVLAGMGTGANQAQAGIAKIGAAAQGTSAQLNAAIAAAAKLSNTKYLIANAPAPVFTPPAASSSEANALMGGAQQLAGAFGVSLGAAGVVQAGKAVIAATQVAVAYDRQGVAARSLAGSQGKLNDLLDAYGKASGGAVDKATSLANVTRLEATGFAESAKGLARFVEGVRGASIAMGKSQDEISQEVQLAIVNQSTKRLDQIGLGVAEVTQRVSELRAANQGLTASAAFQEAVLGLLQEKFGALSKSAAGQVTGLEKLAKAWKNLQLAIGEVSKQPINEQAGFWAQGLENVSTALDEIERKQDRINIKWHNFLVGAGLASTLMPSQGVQDFVTASAGREAGRHGKASPLTQPDDSVRQVHLDWAKGITDLDAQTHTSIIDEETSFGASRAKTVADYSKSVARDEANYARGRLRANIDFLDSMATAARDATRREAAEATDLARTMATARSDATEQEAKSRTDANKQLAKLDADYDKARIRAAADSREKILDAAGKLDAVAVRAEQRSFAKQQKEAADAHDDSRKQIQDGLAEKLDDEKKSLAKSLAQQQDSFDRSIADGRANDALRAQDMRDAFTKSQARAAEDHATDVAQAAEDEADNLKAMDAAHNLRLEQIANQAAADRAALDEQAKTDLLALGVRNAAWQKAAEAKEKAQEKLWDDFMKHVNGTLLEGRPNTPQMVPGYASGGMVDRTGLAFLHAGEFVMPSRAVAAMSSLTSGALGARSVVIHPGAITVYGAVGQSEEALGDIIYHKVADLLEGIAA